MRPVVIADQAFAQWLLRGDLPDDPGDAYCRPCRRSGLDEQRADGKNRRLNDPAYRKRRMVRATGVVATSGNRGECLPAACEPRCDRHMPTNLNGGGA